MDEIINEMEARMDREAKLLTLAVASMILGIAGIVLVLVLS